MTLGRVAALALVGGEQVLMDILGHEDAETTLSYVLSDSELQDEMRVIAVEANIALAERALEDDDLIGPAAERVKAMANRLAPRSAEHHLRSPDLRKAAEILSQGGSVMLVRANVLCTKAFNEFGPCTRRNGAPDVGNCAAKCDHRFELGAAKADHRMAILQAKRELEHAEGPMQDWWQAQLRMHEDALARHDRTVSHRT